MLEIPCNGGPLRVLNDKLGEFHGPEDREVVLTIARGSHSGWLFAYLKKRRVTAFSRRVFGHRVRECEVASSAAAKAWFSRGFSRCFAYLRVCVKATVPATAVFSATQNALRKCAVCVASHFVFVLALVWRSASVAPGNTKHGGF